MAPVVRNRKGEHRKLFADLVARGFVRARVDGEVCEMDDPPELDLRRNHTIEVIVDRLKVREELRQRLAESFETALTLTDGIALVGFIEAPGQADVLFSSRFACPMCDFAIPEMEPRLFSFNNPAGACESCAGLGSKRFFDPERVVRPHLSLAGGAVRGWDRRNAWYYNILESLARHYGFDPEVPFESLPARIRQVVLHGSGRTRIRFTFRFQTGRKFTRTRPFEGVLPNMERRYRETESPRGARGVVPLPGLLAMPRLRRRTPQRSGPQRHGVGALDRGLERNERGSGARILHHIAPERLAAGDCRAHRSRTGGTPAVHGRRGPRLPQSRSPRRDPVRRPKRSAYAWRARSAPDWWA